jgi:hypothetical protein
VSKAVFGFRPESGRSQVPGCEGRQPTAAERDEMHRRAQVMCFIANSAKTEIVVEARETVGARD